MSSFGPHFQNTIPDWPKAVAKLPAGTPVKSVGDYQLLREAKQANAGIVTVFRSHREDLYGLAWDVGGNPAEAARLYFDGFLDGTWWQQEMWRYVDVIEGFNEFLAQSQTEEEVARRVIFVEELCKEWERRKQQHPELNRNGNPIRLALCNTAIGNDIDIRFAEIASRYGHYLAYHPYIYTEAGEQPEWEWDNLSGRWDVMDMEYTAAGYFVDWYFSEGGPFYDALAGWREARCCGGDIGLYTDALDYWIRNAATTPAYHEGRLLGTVLFTVSNDSTWRWFDLDTGDLMHLADYMAAYQFPPKNPAPPPPPPPEPDPATPAFVTDYVDVLPTWTESEYYPYKTRPLSAIESIIIHHSAIRNDVTPEQINLGHINGEGWPRAGYHIYIAGDGTAYKMNNFTTHSFHAGGANASSIGVCIAGDFTEAHPTPEQLVAVGKLLQWLNDVLGEKELLKHLDVSATECPGNTWEEWWNALTALTPLPTVDYVVTCHLMPQDFTLLDVAHVLGHTYDERQSIVYSADDAARLVAPGLPGSRVVVWEPKRWGETGMEIVSWLMERGVQIVEIELLPKPEPPPVSEFDFPVGTIEERNAATDGWPGEWISANGFGNVYTFGNPPRTAVHTGDDLNLNKPGWNSDAGAPVYAVADGVVTFAGKIEGSTWGRIIVIRHPLKEGGYAHSRYGHLRTLDVSQSQIVSMGDRIGTIGGTEYGVADHLHIDICTSGIVDTYPAHWPGNDAAKVAEHYTSPLPFILARKA